MKMQITCKFYYADRYLKSIFLIRRSLISVIRTSLHEQ